MAIVRVGDKFAVLYTENKWHLETIKVVGFKHDWLGVWAKCEIEYVNGTKADHISCYSLGLIAEELRSGYMVKIN